MKAIDKLNLPRDTYEQKMAQDNLIFLCRVGSTMYGTKLKTSDDDIIGVFIELKEYIIGRKKVNQVEFRTNPTDSGKRNIADDIDLTIYSLHKWISLAVNNNPNILELFFVPKNCILYETEYWKELKNNKDLFISLKLWKSFNGYAFSQMKRLGLKSGNNTGRKDLIKKFNFDTKMASHTIRLYLECQQLLKEGQITFPLKENGIVLSIKCGEWSLEDVKLKAKELEKSCLRLYENSKLLHSPKFNEVSKLQMKIYEKFWSK